MQGETTAAKRDLVSKVGGFLKIGRTVCNSEIFLDKEQYYPGEVIKVRIVSDNTACRKPIERFNLLLQQTRIGKDGHGDSCSNTITLAESRTQGGAKKS